LLAGLVAFVTLEGIAPAQGSPSALCEYSRLPNPPDRVISNTVAKLRSGQPVTIVAIGSSSTEGIGVSSPKAAYPALLQEWLPKAFPGSSVSVLNKGKSRQINQELVARLEWDVLAYKPDLVIWQTGTNDAVEWRDLNAFRRSVIYAVNTLRSQGIEVILMDGQFYPEVANSSRYYRYQQALAEIAEWVKVPLVPRYIIMKQLVTELRLPLNYLLAEDQLHPNDFTHACIATYIVGLLQAMP
jgi:lysophospholipase L1-like esterase